MSYDDDDDLRLLEQQEMALDRDLVEAARNDVNTYIECVGRYQWTEHPDGTPIEPWERLKQHPVHEQMQHDMESGWCVFLTFPGIGKTTQVALRQVWKIGHDLNRRILVVSQQMQRRSPSRKLSRMMRQAIEDPFTRAVFPNLRPHPRYWTDKEFMVARSSSDDDPTCSVLQLFGTPTGARVNVVIFDDLYDDKVVRSEEDARRILTWVVRSVLSRFGSNPNTEVVWLTNKWHDRDPVVLLEEDERRLIARGGTSRWIIYHMPLVDSHERSLYPNFIDDVRVQQLRDEFGDQFDVLFKLTAIPDKERTFRVQVLDRAFREDVLALDRTPDEVRLDHRFSVVAGVDPATGKSGRRRKSKKGDRHSISMILCEEQSEEYRLMTQISGRWPVSSLAMIILEYELLFSPDDWAVEDNLASGWLEEILDLTFANLKKDAKLLGEPFRYRWPNIVPRWTGSEKWDRDVGLQSIAKGMRAGRHHIPCMSTDPEVRQALVRLRDGMYGFRPGFHTSDEFMAYWIAIEQARRRSARRVQGQSESASTGGLREVVVTRQDETRERVKRLFGRRPNTLSNDDPYAYLRG